MKTTYRVIPYLPWLADEPGYIAQVRAWWTLGLWKSIGQCYTQRHFAQEEINSRRNVQS